MSDPRQDDDFTPQEKQERFEATIRGALKTAPAQKLAKKDTRQACGGYERTSNQKAEDTRWLTILPIPSGLSPTERDQRHTGRLNRTGPNATSR